MMEPLLHKYTIVKSIGNASFISEIFFHFIDDSLRIKRVTHTLNGTHSFSSPSDQHIYYLRDFGRQMIEQAGKDISAKKQVAQHMDDRLREAVA